MHIKVVEELKQHLNSKWIVNDFELIKIQLKSYYCHKFGRPKVKTKSQSETEDRATHWKISEITIEVSTEVEIQSAKVS